MNVEMFNAVFGRSPSHLLRAPGRIEIGGNHTDHQGGRVLAAAIRRSTTAAVARNNLDSICLVSDVLKKPVTVKLDDLAPRSVDEGTTASLIRGVAAGLRERGVRVEGFDAVVSTEIPVGFGLSSSAAFEIVLGSAISHLFAGGEVSPVVLAQVGQAAERDHFGKPCGLMDQLTSAIGGLVAIDFDDPGEPRVERLDAAAIDPSYDVLVVDSGSSHADLSSEYAVIPMEMNAVAKALGRTRCRDVDRDELLAAIPRLRGALGDRAVLRTLHFVNENERVAAQTQALRRRDFRHFLQLVRASGSSSWRLLQNVCPSGLTRQQPLAVALALAETLLDGKEAASRVLGGGFAGAMEVFLPRKGTAAFTARVEEILGTGAVTAVQVSDQGAGLLDEL